MKTLLLFCRKFVYVSLYLLDRLLRRKSRVIVLCYHSVAKDSWRFSIDPETLKKHILYLKKHYEFITLDDLRAFISGKKHITRPSVVITFDDGYKDVLSVRDFLNIHGVKPALFVLSESDKANLRELDTKRKFLSFAEIKRLLHDGWIIGSHSATHANFAALKPDALYREVILSKHILEQELGTIIPYFAYPKGRYTKVIIAALRKAKYTLALSMDDAIVSPRSNYFTIPRIGVDRTHGRFEFRTLYSPSVITFRRMVKEKIGGILV
jgi:peptidoglycan/xylan/chitin deacetylase (PgdA/CDA1 family)